MAKEFTVEARERLEELWHMREDSFMGPTLDDLEKALDEIERLSKLVEILGYENAIDLIVEDYRDTIDQFITAEAALEDIIKDRPWMDTTDLVDQIFSIANKALAKIREKQVG